MKNLRELLRRLFREPKKGSGDSPKIALDIDWWSGRQRANGGDVIRSQEARKHLKFVRDLKVDTEVLQEQK